MKKGWENNSQRCWAKWSTGIKSWSSFSVPRKGKGESNKKEKGVFYIFSLSHTLTAEATVGTRRKAEGVAYL